MEDTRAIPMRLFAGAPSFSPQGTTDVGAEFRRRGASRRGEELRMTDRAIEIDEQTADGRAHEGCPEGLGQGLRQDQRAGIVPAVRVQPRSLSPKQSSTGRGNPIAAMLTRDEEEVDRRFRLTSAARSIG